MDVDIFKKRRSIREYSDDPISKETLEQIIDAARYAPTARGLEPWEFVVITDIDTLKEIAHFTDHGKFISDAKACIAVFCQDTKYYLEDGSAATTNILNASAMLGVGSCWVAGDKKDYCGKVAELLAVPKSYKLISLIPLGYPRSANELTPKNKRTLKEITHWEKY
ncbi:MAG: nitroreductase family protein [bacterium]